ncbi:Smr/MutS family protein [Candidatus Sumerlaeota bacterium]|nr:Smr/MutS family protein [Candidatus Sumerlaeota bacterium]
MDAQTRETLQFNLVLELISTRASSPLGVEFVRALEPLPGLPEITSRYGLLRDLMRLLAANQSLPLGGLQDVRPFLQKVGIIGTSLDEDDLQPLANFAQIANRLCAFRDRNREHTPALAGMLDQLVRDDELEAELFAILDRDGRIRDDASRELLAARQALRAAESNLLKTVNRLVGELHQRGVLQEQFSTIRNGRHVFPLKSSSRGRVPGIFHGGSGSGETVYVEPNEVVEAGNDVEMRREKEQQEVHRILLRVTELIRPRVPAALQTLGLLAELDGLHALARVAVDRAWSLPTLLESGAPRLINAHHPLLNLRGGGSVPITMMLNRDDRCIILSGPNAGGKTTAMKTLGLLAALVRCGAPIPAFPDTAIPVYTRILSDIGDHQDIQRGLSTFSGHLRRIREIYSECDRDSLVLLDELGTGTDPQEGSALALALLETFCNRAALTITTSHLDNVKVWAEDTEGARNASFSLDPHTHEPTFTLRLDLPGASEALEIAQREGIPAEILQKARGLVGRKHLEMGEMLRRIEERDRRMAVAVREAEARAQSLVEQEKIARARAELLREERRLQREAALREKEKTIAETREKFEKMIAALPAEDDLQRRKEFLIHARAEAIRDQGLTSAERLKLAQYSVETGEFVIGQKVFLKTIRQWATITQIDDDKKVRVLAGAMPVWAKREDLLDHDPAERLAEQKEAADDLSSKNAGGRTGKRSRRIKNALRAAEEYSGPSVRGTVTLGGRSVPNYSRPDSMMLDLHGFRVEEAIRAIDKFLDQSLLSNFPYVKINHGTGTGRLYKAVHEYLRTHPSVRSYNFATPDEGGGGVTVVRL